MKKSYLIYIYLLIVEFSFGQMNLIPYKNVMGENFNKKEHFINGNLLSNDDLSYYSISIVDFTIKRKKNFWKDFTPFLEVKVENGSNAFYKLINTIKVRPGENGDVKRSERIINTPIAQLVPYNSKSIKLSFSLYPVKINDNISKTINSITTVGGIIGAGNSEFMAELNLISNVSKALYTEINSIVSENNTKSDIQYSITLDPYILGGSSAFKFREGYYILSKENISGDSVLIQNNETIIKGLPETYSYMIIHIEETKIRTDLAQYDFYKHLLKAKNALRTKSFVQMDAELDAFRVKLFDSENFTETQKTDLWKSNYSSLVVSAKKIDPNYMISNILFNRDGTIDSSLYGKPTIVVIQQLEKNVFEYAFKELYSKEIDFTDWKEAYKTLSPANQQEFSNTLSKYSINLNGKDAVTYLNNKEAEAQKAQKEIKILKDNSIDSKHFDEILLRNGQGKKLEDTFKDLDIKVGKENFKNIEKRYQDL